MPLTATLTFAIALLVSGPEGGQTSKSAPAKVTLAGKEAGILTIDTNGKKERFVLLDTGAKSTIKVATNQDVTALNEKLLEQHKKLSEDFTALAKKLAGEGDTQGLNKAQKEFQAASAELQQYFSYYVAEGSLTVVQGEIRLAGHLRLYAYKGADKALGKGKAVFEGEATQVMFDAGQGPKKTLAIRNGNDPIVVIGPAAQDLANAKGTVRAHGVLQLHQGVPVLRADAVEIVKK